MTKKIRCAIYTRKSSEEGLEQDFNSLHAQREACSAYILSQASEGWSLLPAEYDDGGLSGGTLERTLLSTGSRVHSYSQLHEAVVLPYCTINRGARLSKVVLDRGVNIPEGLVVGEDPEFDKTWFRRTDDGVTLITQPMLDKYQASR